jgi:hypothetical protein
MYRFHTPSGEKSCDGLAMALRAGLTLRDMEMVQFHPTGLLAGTGTRMTGTVLEEGLRGAGGHLLNGAKERFMENYDPRGERGVVGRNLSYQQMSSVPVLFDETIFNEFMGAGGQSRVVEDFAVENFDHGPLGFVGGAQIKMNSNGRTPMAFLPTSAGAPKDLRTCADFNDLTKIHDGDPLERRRHQGLHPRCVQGSGSIVQLPILKKQKMLSNRLPPMAIAQERLLRGFDAIFKRTFVSEHYATSTI